MYYKDIPYRDMESVWVDNPISTDYPIREYWEHTFSSISTYDLFSEFSQALNRTPGDFFTLTEEEQAKFSAFLDYYQAKYAPWFAVEDDATSSIVNSATSRSVRWNTPRTVQNDRYEEQRTHTAPYVYEKRRCLGVTDEDHFSNYSLNNFTDEDPQVETIPTKYQKEWYYSGTTSALDNNNGQLNQDMAPEQGLLPEYNFPIKDDECKQWFTLIPTAADTPFYDYIPSSRVKTQVSHKYSDFTYANLR